MKYYLLVLFFSLSINSIAAEVVSLGSLKELKNAKSLEKVESNLLVYFWASWCPDCRDKLAGGALQKLQLDFPKAIIITINSDREEAKGVQFTEDEKISLPVYRDVDKALSKSLKLFAIPSWAVLKKDKDNLWKVLMSSTGSDLEIIKQQLQR